MTAAIKPESTSTFYNCGVALAGFVSEATAKGNELLNVFSDGFTERVSIPLLCKSHVLAGKAVARVVRACNPSKEKWILEAWTDPLSIESALKISKPIERWTLSMGKRTPVTYPVLKYLDACLISSAQSLHSFTREANYLLAIPQTLKRIVQGITPGKTVDKFILAVGKRWTWASQAMTKIKEGVLYIVDTILKVVEFVLKFFLMENLFGTLTFIRRIIQATRDKAHSKFSDIANQTIEAQEKGIRKTVVASAAVGTAWWFTSTFSRIALKTALGVYAYQGGINALETSFSIPPALVHVVALPIIGKILWSNAFVPVLDPYFANYDSEFNGEGSHLKHFLNYWGLDTLHIPLMATRTLIQIAGTD